MVQIIPTTPRDIQKQEDARQFGQNILGGIQGFINQRNQAEALRQTGFNPSTMNLPEDLRKGFIEQTIKGRNAAQQLRGEQEVENQNYKIIEDKFGKNFADVWKAAPTGARTELVKHAIDTISRGGDLENMLSGVKKTQPEIQSDEIPEEIPQMKKGKISEKFQWPDFNKAPEGYTPKDWRDERKTWRSENAPIFEKNRDKLKSNKIDALGIKSLNKLNESKKLPEGFEKALIDPETNDFYSVAKIANVPSPEAQQWVKEITRFGNRAKDAFGSRVTNFDLQTYMRQFPGLLNSHEGRRRIINMMDINNKLDALYDEALQNVYQKYGLNGIPQEKADELAQKFIKSDVDRLRDEYLELDETNQALDVHSKIKENEANQLMNQDLQGIFG